MYLTMRNWQPWERQVGRDCGHGTEFVIVEAGSWHTEVVVTSDHIILAGQ